MAAPAQAPLPQDLKIGYGFQVVFAAIDPVTGADVPGVTISNPTLTANDEAGNVVTLGNPGNPVLLGVGG